MRLRDLELGFAFGTAENLALFDFVFIDIDFGGTFGAADHGSILRKGLDAVGDTTPRSPPYGVLYTALVEVNSCAGFRWFERNLRCRRS
jgi:hypothetical protein